MAVMMMMVMVMVMMVIVMVMSLSRCHFQQGCKKRTDAN